MASRTKPAPATDPREQYLERNMSPHMLELTAAALEDVRYFAKRGEEGRPITIKGLELWLLEKHSLKIGRGRLATLCQQHGVKPWWSVR